MCARVCVCMCVCARARMCICSINIIFFNIKTILFRFNDSYQFIYSRIINDFETYQLP